MSLHLRLAPLFRTLHHHYYSLISFILSHRLTNYSFHYSCTFKLPPPAQITPSPSSASHSAKFLIDLSSRHQHRYYHSPPIFRILTIGLARRSRLLCFFFTLPLSFVLRFRSPFGSFLIHVLPLLCFLRSFSHTGTIISSIRLHFLHTHDHITLMLKYDVMNH